VFVDKRLFDFASDLAKYFFLHILSYFIWFGSDWPVRIV